MNITEPATIITDYLLALASLIFVVFLLKSRNSNLNTTVLWTLAFGVAAAAAVVGGTFHGFKLHLSPGAQRSMWNATVGLIGLSGGFMISAGIVDAPRRSAPKRKSLKTGVLVTVIGLVILGGKFSIHTHFNHNDLYHCVQIVAFYFFFRGAKN